MGKLKASATGAPTGGRVKILDFGLARAAGDEANLTQQGAIIGTPSYMAPEQATGQNVDSRCDLFSLGCVLYHLCTGQMPFRGTDTISTLLSVATDEPAAPCMVSFEVPPALSDLIMQLLSKKPENRPASAADVAESLRKIEAGLTGRQAFLPAGSVGHTFPSAIPVRQASLSVKPAVAAAIRVRQPASKKRRYRVWVAAMLGLAGIAFLAQQIIIRITDKEGNSRDVNVPEGGKYEVIRPPLKPIPAGEAISRMALVTNPALVKGVQSWTLETVGHRAGVRAVAFSKDGKWLASGGLDGMVRIWDTATWKLHRILPADSHINSLTWGKDGALWISSADTIQHWEPLKGYKLKTLKGVPGSNSVILFPDEKKLILEGRLIYDSATGDLLDKLEGGNAALLPDGKTLATLKNGRVYLSEANDLTQIRDFALPKGANRVAWAPDGKTLACTNGDQLLWLLNGADGKVLREKSTKDLTGLANCSLLQLAWSAKNELGLTGYGPGSRVPILVLVRPANDKWEGAMLSSMTEPDPSPPAWSPNGQVVAVGSALTGSIYMFRAVGKEPFNVLQGHGRGSIEYLRWSEDGRQIGFFAHPSHEVPCGNTFDAASGKRPSKRLHTWGTSPNGKLQAKGVGGDRKMTISEIKTGKDLPRFGPMPGGPLAMNWSYDNKIFLTGGLDWKVQLWNPLTGEEIKGFDFKGRNIYGVALSPDQKTVACSYDNGIHLLDKDSGESKAGFGLTGAQPLAYSPDGKWLVVGGSSLEIRSHDGKRVLHTIQNPHHADIASAIKSLAWSPDSSTIATGSRGPLSAGDGLIRLWDAATGKLNATLLPLADGRGLAVSREGHFRGTPQARVQREIVCVIQTDKRLETLAPAEFERRFGWKNDPERVRPTP